jgi:Type IV pili methyl-accepting chemotaxis transducer N-term
MRSFSTQLGNPMRVTAICKTIRTTLTIATAVAIVFATLVATSSTPAHAQTTASKAISAPNLADAINRAGRGRALSQRLVKLHAQIALSVNTSRSHSTMLEAISLFETNLAELEAYATTVDSINHTRQVAQAWKAFKISVLATPSKAKLLPLLVQSEALSNASETLTQSYQAQSKSAASAIVNQCGRQRLISQRLAALYMLEEAGQLAPALAAEQAKLRAEFETTLASLRAATVNTPEINAELKLATTQWMFFQSALTAKHGLESARHVASTSERILEVMNNATGMYQRLAASGTRIAAL